MTTGKYFTGRCHVSGVADAFSATRVRIFSCSRSRHTSRSLILKVIYLSLEIISAAIIICRIDRHKMKRPSCIYNPHFGSVVLTGLLNMILR